MGLLAALGLRPLASVAAPSTAAWAIAPNLPPLVKEKGVGGTKTPPAGKPDDELSKAINEAARFAATISDEDAKRELAQGLKTADEQRKAALKLGDQTERENAIKKATEAVKQARAKAASATDRKTSITAGATVAKAEPVKKDEQPKGGVKVITDEGKLGLGGAREFEKEKTTAKGDVVKCNASFEGKAWVETQSIPYSEPPQLDIIFHLTLGASAGGSAERKRDSGVGGKVSATVAAEYELSHKRRMNADETKRYVEAVKAGRSGGWEELKALELAVRGSMTEARALAAKLGGKKREMKEDDETEETLTGKAEGQADVSAKKGAFGIGLSIGASTSGSLSRKIAFKDGKYWITLRSAKAKSGAVGAGFSLEGVGMNVAGSQEEHSSQAVTFVIDPAQAKQKSLLENVMAATTIAQMLDLRAKNPDVASFDTTTKGTSHGSATTASAFGVGFTGGDQSSFSETEIVGPDGKTRVYTGSSTSGGALTAGDKKFAETSKTHAFTGGSGPGNKGFGETSATDKSSDLIGGVRELIDKGVKSPITTAKNLIQGKQNIAKDVSRTEGAALTDASFGLLEMRAKGNLVDWNKFGVGNLDTLIAWGETYHKVRKAGPDRALIAKAIAEFESGSGRGRHETVRNAIAGTEVAFELPPSLLPRKAFFDSLVVNDPIPAALGLGTPAEVLKKLEELLRQLEGFRKDMSNAQADGDFVRFDDYQDMAARIDQRSAALRNAIAATKAKIKAADDKAKGINQFTPIQPMQSIVDPAKEKERKKELVTRSIELKRNIGEAYADEQGIFGKWETDLKGWVLPFVGVSLSTPGVQTLMAHENKLKALYPRWDLQREELRKVLKEAGEGFDSSEADVLQPDRPRYRGLRARGPHAGEPDGV